MTVDAQDYDVISLAAEPALAVAEPVPSVLTRTLRRREDQLNIRFDFHNLTLDTSVAGAPVLRRKVANQPAYVVAGFPPQHLAEQSFREPVPTGGLGSSDPGNSTNDATTWPVTVRLAEASRLAFALPTGLDVLPFDVDTLLRWGDLLVTVVPAALPRGAQPPTPPQIRAPLAHETAIELPWRLLLSPHAGSGWAHARQPITRNGRTELWHTRLGVARRDGTVDELGGDRSVRAVWGTDPNFSLWLATPGTAPDGNTVPAPGLPFRMPLTPKNRVELVRATSDHRIAGFVPQPVEVERLMLTGLGGWLDSHGTWSPPPGTVSLQEWKHRTTMGRDQDVRIVERGYLLPFGHRVAIVARTERKVDTPGAPQPAYLRQRLFMVVRQPTVSYPAFAQDAGGRRFPFQRLQITTLTTPDLDEQVAFVPGTPGAFVPQVAGAPYEFHFVAADRAGKRVEFTAPVVFVDSTTAFNAASITAVCDTYNDLAASGSFRRRPLHGQQLALAESAARADTDVETIAITFGVEPAVDGQPTSAFITHDQPRFHPAMAAAAIRLPAAERLSGTQLGTVEVTIDETYATDGFSPARNAGQVYARLLTSVGLGFGTDRAGPMTPGMDIVALSRTLGPVGGDLATVKSGTFDTAAVLAAAPNNPQIMGGVKLSDIFGPVPVTDDGVMRLTTDTRSGAAQQLAGRSGSTPETFFHFTMRPKPIDDPFGMLRFYSYSFAQVDLEMRVDDLLDGGDATNGHYLFQALLSNAPPWSLIKDLPDPSSPGPRTSNKPAFTLRLIGKAAKFIEVDFLRFVLRVETGKDVYLSPVIGSVRFFGPLRFVQQLQEALSTPTPAGDPKLGPIITPTSESLEVGLKVGLPDIPVGVFALKNVMVGMSVVLPFLSAANDGKKRPVRFNFYFCERENPFLLAVYCFGGGGYFLISMGTDGVEWFEIALEFGVHMQGSVGVASGLLDVMAGIYFRLDVAKGVAQCTLTGYLRIHGHVAVLGIVTISLEVYLGLTYQSVGNKVIGQAIVILEIDVLFFSYSASFQIERQFGGDQNDPTFLDQMPSQSIWDDYTAAFAPIGG